jgi:hydroxymethylbilane synthase
MIIGTRGSELALWQTRHVQARLGGEAAGVTFEIIKTSGDRLLDIPLQQQLDKGFFTKELEVALADRRVDAAVHSLKDLPTLVPPGLVVAAIPERADVGDLLFVHPDALDSTGILPLKAGTRVGTASLRRMALLKHLRPDLEPAFLRGNVPTRLGKCKSGELGAVILARAGITRLGLDPGDLAVFDLDPTRWLPAAAQGAMAIEARSDDSTLLARLRGLHDVATADAVSLERELLRRIEGGCHTAFGAIALGQGDDWTLHAGMTGEDGTWRHVTVHGRHAGLVDAAFARLQSMTSGAYEASDSPWFSTARPWA